MAKKIRSPLVMADGTAAHNLEEFREHFDLEKAAEYYKNGKLQTWLRIRYYDDEADALEALDVNNADFQKKLCGIFGVEFTGSAVDLEEIERRQERLAKLREYTDEKELIDRIDQIAFDQEDLADLLGEETETIYLCGKYFVVPARCSYVTYIGINQPTVHISGLEKGTPLSPDIHFKQLKVENLPSTEKCYASLDSDWQECYILHPNDTLPEGVKETDSVEAWLKRCYKALGLNHADELSIVAMPKLDGVALRGEVDTNNCLNNPLLRGDEKKSILVKGLNHIRLTDEKPISDTPFGCQFEVFVTYEDAEKASQYLNLEKPYVSPRHAASGMINRLCVNPDDNLVPFLSFYPINTEDLEGTYVDRLNLIDRFGNVDVVETKVLTGDLDQLLRKIERRFRKLNNMRGGFAYAVDGLVLSIADDAQQETIGRNGRTNKWQIAWKFDPASTVGEVKGIELSSGKKGFRTIQIVLKEPVSIDGVKYDHVPALSADIFERYNLCEGDLIRIHRVGDVIPSISIEERKGGKKIELPKKCPVCGEDMIWEAKKLKCVNFNCKANQADALLTFFQYADIKGIGEVEAQSMARNGISLPFMIECSKYYHDRGENPAVAVWGGAGFDKLKSEKILKDVSESINDMWDYEFIGHCGIPGVGPETAKKAYCNLHTSWISDTDDYFLEYFNTKLDHVRDLIKVARTCTKRSTYDHFANLKSVGHTGGMPDKETQKFIRKLGWELVDGKKFDYLIIPSYGHESTKTKVAKEKGIEMFTEEDFVEEFSEDI